jgi:hypothetical protein
MVSYPNGTVHVLGPNGAERPGWPQKAGIYDSYCYLALADLERNGSLEILVSTSPELVVLRGNGTVAARRTNPMRGQFAVADITGDGRPEILAVEDDSAVIEEPLAAHRSTAQQRRAWAPLDRRTGSSSAGAQSLWYRAPELRALESDLAVLRSWRLQGMEGEQPLGLGSPVVGDFNSDGRVDIAVAYPTLFGGGSGGFTYEGVATALTTGASAFFASDAWPMVFQNSRNNAVVPTPRSPYRKVPVTAGQVTASAWTSPHVPANTVDGKLSTRWVGVGDGAWIRYDLGTPRTVAYVKIAVYEGNVRRNRFDLQVSPD